MGAQISIRDIKLLWGRAGGRCSAPDCNEDLTALIESGGYVIGEMAHVIGRKPSARRGKSNGGANTYDNLILLCPNHHTHVDKAPEDAFPKVLLHEWKQRHEEVIRSAGKIPGFDSFDALRAEVTRLLAENRALFETLGPRSSTARANPDSNLFTVWEMRRLDRIVPNNKRIISLIDANAKLIPAEAVGTIEAFRVHASAYEHHCYHPLDSYPLFPDKFPTIFSIHEKR